MRRSVEGLPFDPPLRKRAGGSSLRRPRFFISGGLTAGLLAAIIVATPAGTEPAAIESQRAQVAQIQAERDRLSNEVSEAAEAYNGARYELGQVRERIRTNSRLITVTQRDLRVGSRVLSKRLVQLYATPEPSIAEVMVTSGSITEVAERFDMLERVGAMDASVVHRLRTNRERLARARGALVEDRAEAKKQLAARVREKARIEGLLREREAVLQSAQSELQRLVRIEEERQRREAERQRRLAEQRAAQARAAERAAAARAQAQAQANETPAAPSSEPNNAPTPSGGTPEPAANPSAPEPEPAPEPTPAPSSSGNSGAVSVALAQQGVPYRWGGSSPSTGFDCSGLASYAYAQIGKSVPHYTVAAYNAFPKVSSSQLAPGDLVFFRGLNHMGIYIGGVSMSTPPRPATSSRFRR